KDRHPAGMGAQRPRDLQRCDRQASWRMQDDVDRLFARCGPDGVQDFLCVIHVDIARDRKAEEAHRLLTMDYCDDSRLASLLYTRELGGAFCPQPARCDERLQREEDE